FNRHSRIRFCSRLSFRAERSENVPADAALASNLSNAANRAALCFDGPSPLGSCRISRETGWARTSEELLALAGTFGAGHKRDPCAPAVGRLLRRDDRRSRQSVEWATKRIGTQSSGTISRPHLASQVPRTVLAASPSQKGAG